MNKAILISIRPEWCAKIVGGEKTVEVRKTCPKLKPPFRAYVYCSSVKAMPLLPYVKLHAQTSGLIDVWSGKVIASFVCDLVDTLVPAAEPYGIYDISDDYVTQSCLAGGALWDYGNGATLYGWHISDLKIYDKPRELRDFKKINRDCFYADLGLAKRDCPDCKNSGCYLERPPQSWCYVEESPRGEKRNGD